MTNQQAAPNIHEVLKAIRELEKHPAVAAYLALQRSLEKDLMGPLTEDKARKILADWHATGPGKLRSELWKNLEAQQSCAHVADYYKYLANGNVCEAALAAARYELASQ